MKHKLFLCCLLLGATQAHAASLSIDTQHNQDWQWLHDSDGWPNQLAAQGLQDANLVLEPYTSTWTGAFHAPFLYRQVTGDFMVTTRVKVEGLSGPDFRWDNIGSKAGLLVRRPTPPAQTWQPADENYLLLVTGDATYCVPCVDLVAVEQGQTRALINHGQHGWVNLRLVRWGAHLVALYQWPQQPWVIMQLDGKKLALDYHGFDMDLYQNPKLPATLQVGLTAMADSPTLDSPRWRRMEDDGTLAREFNQTVIKDGAKRDARAFFSSISIRPFSAPKAWRSRALNRIQTAELLKVFGQADPSQ